MEKWTLVAQRRFCGPAARGLERLGKAFKKAGIEWKINYYSPLPLKKGLIFVGYGDEPAICRLTDKTPANPEGFCFAKNGDALIVSAGGAVGLGYALYELAERVEDLGEAALADLACGVHVPRQSVRGVDRLISNSGDESWWLSEDYWRFYLEMLFSSRFNRLTFLTGFDTAYFAPPYPFFVDVPGFESVKAASSFSFSKDAYLAMLRRIGDLCHDYGMEFSFAIWQQIPWQTQQQRLVEGIDEDNIMEYCAQGVKALLTACPQIDNIHFRVNHESGVGTQTSAEDYWLRQIDAVAEVNDAVRPIKLELRAKGMTDKMVLRAKERGLDVTVSTKYCCEHAGLPHHLTQMRMQERKQLWNFNMSRRYSYADMVRKPLLHRFLYRLWNNGSTDLFTWGDPDYVKRFMDSLRLGCADGYEVMPPLSLKGGHEYIMESGWNLFDDPAYQPGGFEEERYWLFYRLFGRLGYDLAGGEEVWMRPLRARLGESAGNLFEALRHASRILPFIVGFHFPAHPQLHNWPEMHAGAALFAENNFNSSFKHARCTFGGSPGSDEGLFYSIEEYVLAAETGAFNGRYTPYQCAMWLADMADSAEKAANAAKAQGVPAGWEAKGILLDAQMLVKLARFYREKIFAAIGLSEYEQLGAATRLDTALAHMKAAREIWAQLSEMGRAYHSNLLFGVGANCVRQGTWADYQPEIDADIARLCALCAQNPGGSGVIFRAAGTHAPLWEDNVPASHKAGTPMEVVLKTGGDGRPAKAPVLRYRRTNNLEGVFKSLEMTKIGDAYQATIPAEEFSPEWDMMVYFDAQDEKGDGVKFPGLFHPGSLQPYRIVTVEE